tara:strand:- start:697 stop:1197 length:501 start_codon:yes stop_codon:yes gene_type:complete
MAEPMLEEEQMIMDKASAVDEINAESVSGMGPSGLFEMNQLNEVVDALNQVLPFFGAPSYPEFSQDIDGDFPAEFTQQLMMVSAAAEDAGLERLSFDVSVVETPDDLEDISAKLDVLSKDQNFKTFLRTEKKDAEQEVESPVEAEAEVVDEAIPEEDLEMMMAQRA